MINTLTARKIRKATNRFVIGTAAMAVACSGIALTPTTADAVISYYSCSKGGFTGTIVIDHTPSGRFLGPVVRINYKINKGRNSGGNKANVYYVDDGFLPQTRFNTGDAGIQDNNQHYLGGPYRAGGQGINARFVFDKSFASDPSCSIRIQ
ncbi:hypothetical protein [Nostoc sp. ChiVER01]|uniref:hypothetical protein n=1 Tax=Nostoc sp. ChiVER01 TaxID=3075382 RepID=UPI002AD44326|nr:hypothetical protein [Nostoc sp. ChiVER01]MDZ8222409.1 hypothetical protein [Nostoc sp. ChiVER01]